MSKTRFYRIYSHIWNRCNRKSNENYSRYGGRGIINEWNNFSEFLKDMYDSYVELSNHIGEENVSIERINNDGNYNKSNCKWIHISKQQSNRRSNHYIEYKGENKCLSERAKYLGINESVLRMRIVTRKWDVDKAFNTASNNVFGNPQPYKIKYNGGIYTVRELEKIVPYSRKTIYRKIKLGLLSTKSIEEQDIECIKYVYDLLPKDTNE